MIFCWWCACQDSRRNTWNALTANSVSFSALFPPLPLILCACTDGGIQLRLSTAQVTHSVRPCKWIECILVHTCTRTYKCQGDYNCRTAYPPLSAITRSTRPHANHSLIGPSQNQLSICVRVKKCTDCVPHPRESMLRWR